MKLTLDRLLPREFILEARLGERGHDSELSTENREAVAAVRETLITRLPNDMREIYDLDITVRIKAVRDGSLAVFFAVTIMGVSALSRYKNLYDSIQLVRHQASIALRYLQDRFGRFQRRCRCSASNPSKPI